MIQRATLGVSMALLLLAGSLAAAVALAPDAKGQDDGASESEQSYIGPRNCRRRQNEPLGGGESPADSRVFVMLNESMIWEGQDRHRRAFDALAGELGQRMVACLGEPQPLDAVKS